VIRVMGKFFEKMRPKQGYRLWIARNIWIFLVVALLVSWIITWVLSNWASPRLNTMANIASAIGIVGLGALTYIFSRYIKGLAESTKSQAEATKAEVETIETQAKATIDLAKATEATIKRYNENLKRMLRPLLVPELVKEKNSRWEKWEGTFRIRNVGNGPALKPTIRVSTQVVTHIKMEEEEVVYEKALTLMGIHNDPVEITVPLKIPVSARSIVTQRPVKLSYVLEIHWNSMYEEEPSKSVTRFYLGLDRSGDAVIDIQGMEINWDAELEAESKEIA